MANNDISHDNLSEWNSKQIEEILGEDNRRFFFYAHGREPKDDNELALHYINNGGATGFNDRNEKK